MHTVAFVSTRTLRVATSSMGCQNSRLYRFRTCPSATVTELCGPSGPQKSTHTVLKRSGLRWFLTVSRLPCEEWRIGISAYLLRAVKGRLFVE